LFLSNPLKAYNLNLAEALWDELQEDNVRVVACVAGATSTPNFKKSKPKKSGFIKAPVMKPEKVAKIAFKGLLKNKPYIVTGCTNAFCHFMMRHFMSRKRAVKFMGKVARNMFGENKDHSNE
jgi:hypothetical protein